jgi:hypothetical protein
VPLLHEAGEPFCRIPDVPELLLRGPLLTPPEDGVPAQGNHKPHREIMVPGEI